MYARRERIRCYARSTVTVCTGLFLYELFVYDFVFLYRILPTVPSASLGAIGVLCGLPTNALWVVAVWSYLKCCYTDPGRISEEWRCFVKATAGLIAVEAKTQWQPGQATTSQRSKDVRPERAHYCKVCQFDVLRMDHFCPWVGNVIGFRNFKFFILTLVYLDLCLFWGVLTVSLVVGVKLASDGLQVTSSSVSHIEIGMLVSCWIIAVLALVMFTITMYTHLPRAFRNLTSIERKYTNMANPYDLGNHGVNIAQVMGVFGWDWLLPIMPRRPLSDGFSFRKSREVLPNDLVEAYYEEEESEEDEHPDPKEIWKFRYTNRYDSRHLSSGREDESDDEETSSSRALLGQFWPSSSEVPVPAPRKKRPAISGDDATNLVATPSVASSTVALPLKPELEPAHKQLDAAASSSAWPLSSTQPALASATSESPGTLPQNSASQGSVSSGSQCALLRLCPRGTRTRGVTLTALSVAPQAVAKNKHGGL